MKILQNAAQRPTKVHFFPFKQVSGRKGNHESHRMTNASYCVIWYEKFRKVMQRTGKETLLCTGLVFINILFIYINLIKPWHKKSPVNHTVFSYYFIIL